MLYFIMFVILFFVVIGIASSSRKQTSFLENQQTVMNEQKRQAALTAASRRECPRCSESISRKAIVCHYCKSDVEPKYVDDPTANKQIVEIITLHKTGMEKSEISQKLNEKGDKFLADGSDWCEEKVDNILNTFNT